MTQKNVLDNNDPYFILIDMSYMIFYRYHALCRWWKLAKPDISLPDNIEDCEEFVEKFKYIFSKMKETIIKKLCLQKKVYKFICAKDCPRNSIWRNAIYSNYKCNRVKNDIHIIGKFFQMIYKPGLLESIGFEQLLEMNYLEGDDIIAIVKRFLREKYSLNVNIIIIANDYDYLQLIDEKTHLINLAFKIISYDIKIYKNAKENLLIKILTGDKSDSIPPVFNKLTKKRLKEYIENNDTLQNDLKKYDLVEQFNLNSKLIDFTNIPDELVISFIDKYKEILNLF